MENSKAPKFKRSRDGCQNCKKTRIKCDRTKPICKVCLRRNLVCDYSMKLTFVNVQESDSRHPSFKRLKKSKQDTNGIVAVKIKEEPTVVINPNDPMIHTSDEYIQIGTKEPINLLHIERTFSQFFDMLSPDVTKIFQTRESLHIYQHYLSVTCSSLDPLHGPGPENISQKFFLPVAVNDPATFHGILAISSCQLSNTNPAFKELSLVHKSLSYKHLYSLLLSPKKSISLEIISAIICQLSIEIIQSGVKNWVFHINALRRIINQRKKDPFEEDQTTWFIYLRVARYDNFACLTTGENPLFKSINTKEIPVFNSYHPTIQNIDCIFGCPSDALFFCAELSHISRILYEGKSLNDLGYSEVILQLRLFEILNNDYTMSLTDDWLCIKNMWCSAMVIHFYHCLEDKDHLEYTKIYIQNFFQALEKFIELDSFFCANLLWPILKIAYVVKSEIERNSLRLCLEIFYQKTNIGAFKQLNSLIEETWELVDNGSYTKPSKWWEYQQSRESWNLYMA